MRVLTDPAETGAVTVCFPQDVQAQAHDWPVELFAKRVWHVSRPLPETRRDRAGGGDHPRRAERPLIVAGGGVHYSGATDALAAFCAATGIPVGQTQAGKGTLLYDHPQCLGAIGSTGTTAANAIAREADVVIGIGTRYYDFTTASRTAFADPGVRFVNINVAGRRTRSSTPGWPSRPTPARPWTPCRRCSTDYGVDDGVRRPDTPSWTPSGTPRSRGLRGGGAGARPAQPERGDRRW